MLQAIFFALLIVSLLGGYFAYIGPSKKPVNPMKFVMDRSGYTDEQTLNKKRTQEINVSTNEGVLQIHKQMDNIAQQQNIFMDALADQQQILKGASKDAYDVLLEAKKQGENNDNQIQQIERLSLELRDEQKLMVAHGQDLVALNDELTKTRNSMAEQVDFANVSTADSLSALKQRFNSLQTQANGFFGKIEDHNQEVRNQMNEIQNYLDTIARNTSYGSVVKQQAIKERIRRVMDRQRQYMIALADVERRTKDFMREAEQRMQEAKLHTEDSLLHTNDIIDEERQKQKDKDDNIQQRLEDQRQRMQDKQDR